MRIILGLFIIGQTLLSQQFPVKFDHLSIEHGLSQSAVSAIVQDQTGFMWFGTQEGLNRYDGYRFTVFRHDPADSFSISDNYIWAMKCDAAGDIWIGTNLGGLNRFDPVTGRFERFLHDPGNPFSLSHYSVRSIYIDRSGALWVGTRNGLNLFDASRRIFKRFASDSGNGHSIRGNIIRAILEDHNGFLWIGTNSGVSVLDKETGQFRYYQHDPLDQSSISDNTVWSIFEDAQNRIWIGTRNGGVNLYDRMTGRFKRFQHDPNNQNGLSHNGVWTIYQDRSGTLWFGTEGGGVNRYDEGMQRFIHYQPRLNTPGSLSHGIVQSIYEDKSGLLWIGTFGGGINVHNPWRNKFTHYKNNPDDPFSLSYNYVWAILQDYEGKIWIGTEGGGLNLFIPEKNQFRHYRYSYRDPSSINSNTIRCLWEDADHQLWIGTDKGMDRWDAARKNIVHFKPDISDPHSLSHGEVYTIKDDDRGYIWVGTQGGGLNRIDKKAMTFKKFTHQKTNPASLSHNIVRIVFIDSKKRLWVGTDDGLDRYNRTSEDFSHYRNDPDNPNSLGRNMILSLFEDKEGFVWAGTFGGGLNRLNTETGAFVRITQKDGLANDVIYGILEDNQDNIWVSTNRGLSKITFRTTNDFRIRNYDINDGLQSDEFNQSSYCQTRDGKFLFGGINGFNIFHPDSVKDNPFIPPVVLTSFQKFNRPYRTASSLHTLRHLDLSYKDYVFSFEFSALCFSYPYKNQYAYKMEGFDDEWIEAGNRRFVTYTNLDQGEYVFRVKGSNSDGIWNEEGTSLSITIHPPVWNTWWFKVLSALVILGSAAYWYTERIRKIECQKKILEHQVSERTRELRQKTDLLEAANRELVRLNDLKNEFLGIAAHDLRNPLTAMIGFIDLIILDIKEQAFDPGQSLEDLESILKSGKQMSHLISELLDISAIESGKINLNLHKENLQTIFDECEMLHRRRALQKNIRLIVEKNNNIPAVMIDKSRIAEVVDNLLSNAIKYTFPGGEVRLFCEIALEEVVTNIRDTGQGLSDADLTQLFQGFKRLSATPTAGETSTGLGLAIVKKIVNLHGGNVWVKSHKGQGSTFSFSLPLKVSGPIPDPS